MTGRTVTVVDGGRDTWRVNVGVTGERAMIKTTGCRYVVALAIPRRFPNLLRDTYAGIIVHPCSHVSLTAERVRARPLSHTRMHTIGAYHPARREKTRLTATRPRPCGGRSSSDCRRREEARRLRAYPPLRRPLADGRVNAQAPSGGHLVITTMHTHRPDRTALELDPTNSNSSPRMILLLAFPGGLQFFGIHFQQFKLTSNRYRIQIDFILKLNDLKLGAIRLIVLINLFAGISLPVNLLNR